MRIERSPIARSKVTGDKKLTYRLGNNPCLEHYSNGLTGDKDTTHAVESKVDANNVTISSAGSHAAYCPKALFTMNKYTGQLSVRFANILDVRRSKEFTLNVITTDPGGLEDSTTMQITVLESNDVPEMYSFVLHVDENQRSLDITDISPAGVDHHSVIGKWTTDSVVL